MDLFTVIYAVGSLAAGFLVSRHPWLKNKIKLPNLIGPKPSPEPSPEPTPSPGGDTLATVLALVSQLMPLIVHLNLTSKLDEQTLQALRTFQTILNTLLPPAQTPPK